MSRTNPNKKKPRSANRTLLVYGEGLHEEIFLKYLKGLYYRDSGVRITIYNGNGGTATAIIIRAVNEPGAFNRRIVILDNDKSQQEMNKARMEAKRRNIELLENSPCLEATFLTILSPGKSFSHKTSKQCKSEFESNYLNHKRRNDLGEYNKIFPKNILDAQRIHISELNKIISLMEGK